MDGVHDMGGMHGFGPVDPASEDPYHEQWEVRVHAISTALAAPGGGRFALESLSPEVYLASSYYERWLQARVNTLVAHGYITQQELDVTLDRYRQDPAARLPADDPARYKIALAETGSRGQKDVESVDPVARFGTGDQVLVKTTHPKGHTRLPRYVRGKPGKVIRVYRAQGFQDGEPMSDHTGTQPMYAVWFDGLELWGDHAEANSSVVLDMWEAYLQ